MPSKLKVRRQRFAERYHGDADFREHCKTKAREGYWRYQYGIEEADVDVMILAQCGKCAICGNSFDDSDFDVNGRHKTHFRVDHDHGTGKVRGLLCNRCNSGLAFLEDCKWMGNAQDYLS